ncbi:MAG: FkbM family methyltransferase [Phenylobacterium sp.]
MSSADAPRMLEARLGAAKAYRTRHGTMIAPPRDAYVGRSLELYGEYCPAEAAALAQLIRPGMTVVEVGGNLGSHTVAMARACAPGPLYVFEPQQRLFQMLCANLVLNGVTNVIACADAVGAAEGAAQMPALDYEAGGNFGGMVLQAAGRQQGPLSVRVRTLDSLGLVACDLIKVDVEGWEEGVLRGAAATIARFRPLLYVENDRPSSQQALVDLVDQLGYEMWWHTPLLYDPNNFNGEARNIFPGVASLNMFCTPKEKGVGVQGLTKVDPRNIDPPLRAPPRSGGQDQA